VYHYREIEGLPVFLKDEKPIGTVDGLVVDPVRKQVGWLSLNSGGRYEGRHWVSAGDVQRFDGQVVRINSEASIQSPQGAGEAESLVRAGYRVIGRRVVTQNGEDLGLVQDYAFAPSTLVLTELVISSGPGNSGNSLSIHADHIVNILQDKIVIAQNPSVISAKAVGPERPAGQQPQPGRSHFARPQQARHSVRIRVLGLVVQMPRRFLHGGRS
jgi:uncharacterized protein YrrD